MRLLIAEDEKAMSDALAAVLAHFGYDVDVASNGKEAVDLAEKQVYDCMVFDIMMPVMDGVTALETLRKRGDVTPVILLTAKSEVEDRIAGLDAGADDYLGKPFSMAELMARIRSLTRRRSAYTPDKLQLANVTLDVAEQELTAENSIRLSARETRLLSILMMHPGKSFSAGELLRRSDGDEDDGEEGLRMYMSYLREKIGAVHGHITITAGDEGFSLTEEN